jgi:hypothetical protein
MVATFNPGDAGPENVWTFAQEIEQAPDGAEFSLDFVCTGSDWLWVYVFGATLIPDFC